MVFLALYFNIDILEHLSDPVVVTPLQLLLCIDNLLFTIMYIVNYLNKYFVICNI